MENVENLFEKLVAFILLTLSIPVLFAIWVVIKLDDGGPLFFKQKRTGKGKKEFYIYKIRTMILGADKLKKKLARQNETDGPVFKIYNDPRHTKVGRFLSHTGLDELPQLLNIIKGDMSFVGPRPLPPGEAKKIAKKYGDRFKIKPGITSSWVVSGAHELTFKEWMERDLKDVEEKSFKYDFLIGVKTFLFLIKLSLGKAKTYSVLAFFVFVFLFGLSLRFYLATNKAMWADEFFYFSMAVNNSVKSLLLVQHWIKDNPPGFLLFIKFWTLFGKNLLWLRLTGFISYVISFFLFYRIFDKLKWFGKLTALSFFSFSPFFINVNFWLSPYNFVLLFTLLQINLLKNFMEGRYKHNRTKFVVFFGVFNLLAINSHYSAVYLFFSYPILLVYFFVKKRSLFTTFLISMFVSFLMLTPNIVLLFFVKNELRTLVNISYLSKLPLKDYGYFDFIIYFLNRSLLRFNNIKTIQYFLLGSGLLLSFFYLKLKKKFNLYFLFFLLYYLLPVYVFMLLFISDNFDAIVAERTYAIFHIGFYFLIASIIFYAQKPKGKFVYVFVSISLLVLNYFAFRTLTDGSLKGEKFRIPAEVIGVSIDKKREEVFLNKFQEVLSSNNYDRIYFVGDDKRTVYMEDIVLDYYFLYDPRFEEAKGKYKRNESAFLVKESIDRGSPYHPLPKKDDKILVVNFEKDRRDNIFLENAPFLKEREYDVIDFWSP